MADKMEVGSSSESASEESAEDEPVWTTTDERDFLRTLGALKTQDSTIYKQDVRFFEERKDAEKSKTAPKSYGKSQNDQKMFLRDYERKLVLERGGKISDDEEEEKFADSDEEEHRAQQAGPSYFEEERALKKSFKEALSSDDDDKEETLLRKKVKTEAEQKTEEDDYLSWLKGEGKLLTAPDENLRKLKKRWSKDNELDEGEKFLRDYLLSKQYENDEEIEEEGRIPSYEEIVREEEEEERAEEFEHKYNFRFEEPDQDFLKQYPRTVKESLRKGETARKKKREKEKEEKAETENGAAPSFNEDDEEGFTFRYRTVPANSFGLSVDEILNTDDRLLNKWAPISRVVKYRTEAEERRDLTFFERKARDAEKKRKMFETSLPPKKSKAEKKAERQMMPATASAGTSSSVKVESVGELSGERLSAYGVSIKKLKRLQYNKKQDKKKARLEKRKSASGVKEESELKEEPKIKKRKSSSGVKKESKIEPI